MTDPLLSEPVPSEVAEHTARAAESLAVDLGSSAEQVRAHVEGMPPRYLAAMSPRAVVRHTLLTVTPPGPGEVRTRVTGGEDIHESEDGDPSVDVLDVVARDRAGWFARVAGVIALHGGSILAAEAFSQSDGLAIDTFRVRPPKGSSGSWWARVEGDLHDTATGRLAVRARVARMARGERERIFRRPKVATQVRRVADLDSATTVVEVRGVDRTGVLYAIASALAELEVDIIGARVRTVGHEVVDEFACRGPQGALDDDHLAEIELAIVTGIEGL